MTAVKCAILLLFVVAITMVNTSDNKDSHTADCMSSGKFGQPCDPRNGSTVCGPECKCRNSGGKYWTCR
ncbi:hypothetical protein MTO96_027919 [Rhipicephalus appendiculatus]